MPTTRPSFLLQLRDGGEQPWKQLHDLYSPLIITWLRQLNLRDADIDDVAQEIMLVVLRRIGEFDHNGRVGAFRNWLRTIASYSTRSYLRKQGREYSNEAAMEMLTQLEDPGSQLSKLFDREHNEHVLRELMARMDKKFEPNTTRAFRMLVLDGEDVETVADELEMTKRAVYIAKSRVLRKLREEAADWLEDLLSARSAELL